MINQSVDINESYASQLSLRSSWNYDEINELRTRFISLLSADIIDKMFEKNKASKFLLYLFDKSKIRNEIISD